jgi:peptidoglycan/xylan/chitin deacetylase (PgdA/CDA1 family)
MNVKILEKIQDKLLRTLGTMVSPAEQRAKLLILIYHRVLSEPDPILTDIPDVSTFDWQMEIIKNQFNVLPLSEAIYRLDSDSLPERAICVTFDDGYADNFKNALPILRKWRISATFFVAVGFIDGGRMWNDTVIETVRRLSSDHIDLRNFGLGLYTTKTPMERRLTVSRLLRELRYLPFIERARKVERIACLVDDLSNNLMMTSEQICILKSFGMEIGAHTVNHPILTDLPGKTAEMEIIESRNILQDIWGSKIELFAYPNGRPEVDYNRQHVDMLRRSGFSAAVSTAYGFANKKSDLFQLPRVGCWGSTRVRLGLQLLKVYLSKPERIV